LDKAKQELKSELDQLASVKDVTDNDRAGLREVHIELKEKAHLLGLDLRTVVQQVRSGFFGNEVQRLQRGLDEVKVWVRYGMDERRSIGQLERMRIRHEGNEYPLHEIARFQVERGILSIEHLNGNREITVSGDLADPDRSATAILENVQNEILPPILAKYPGIQVSYEGQSRESQKTSSSGARVVPIILILMIAIVTLLFRSVGQALVVFLVLPLGIIGVGWGHYLMGSPISILSIYGVIALIGIMINDSLVLVNRMNNLLKQGKDFMTAIYEAAVSRFRPILLTSLTTIGGLAPLMLAQSFQAQFVIPMAISVVYGMILATLITLMILPCFLVIQNQVKVYATWLWTGQRPNMEDVEPGPAEVDDEGNPVEGPSRISS
jgi:multidrug efflux pump subunit AcrB